jgi:hypothetical protein
MIAAVRRHVVNTNTFSETAREGVQGKHEELLEQNGFYAELYNSQFESAEADG